MPACWIHDPSHNSRGPSCHQLFLFCLHIDRFWTQRTPQPYQSQAHSQLDQKLYHLPFYLTLHTYTMHSLCVCVCACPYILCSLYLLWLWMSLNSSYL